MNKIRTRIVCVSLALFLFSLTQTAITYHDIDGRQTHQAFSLFIMGVLSILGGGMAEWLVWLANPFYVLAPILFVKSKKRSKTISTFAAILALSFTTWKNILAAENGRTAAIEHLNAGYWLWLLSMIVLAAGTRYYFRQVAAVPEQV